MARVVQVREKLGLIGCGLSERLVPNVSSTAYQPVFLALLLIDYSNAFDSSIIWHF